MKKVLVVDWLDSYGGAERVIKSFCKVFSFDKCHTLINIMLKSHENEMFNHQNIPVQQTKIKYFGKRFRYVFFLFQYAIKTVKIDKDVDLIISSSHAIAKGVLKSRPDQVHISYFQARNFKHIWSEAELYFGKLYHVLYPLISVLRKNDLRQSKNPDYIISNSLYVKQWVKETYGLDTYVIYPPVDLSNFSLKTTKSEFYVAVGRLEPYKRFDLVVDAFNLLEKELVVIGDGSQLKTLKKMANANIKFLGFLDSTNISKYVSTAKGFIHAGIEDFGIAPIEAQACGTPVVGYNKGGLKETVIDGVTGILFDKQDSKSIQEAILKFEHTSFVAENIREHALKYSKQRFEVEFSEMVEKLYNNHVKLKAQS